MADTGSIVQALISELSDFFQYVKETLADPAQKKALAHDLGGTLKDDKTVEYPPSSEAGLNAYREASDPGMEAAASTLKDARAVLSALRDVATSIDTGGAATVDELADAALDLLATTYVRVRHPKLYFAMQFVGYAVDATGQFGEGEVFFERFLVSVVRLLDYVVTGGQHPRWRFQTDDDVRRFSFLFLRAAAAALLFVGPKDEEGNPKVRVLYGWDAVPGKPQSLADKVSDRMITLQWREREYDDDPLTTLEKAPTISLALVPRDHGGPGVFFALGGQYELKAPLNSRWQVAFKADSSAGAAFLVGQPHKSAVGNPASENAPLAVSLGLESRPAAGKRYTYAIPDGGSNRLEIGKCVFSLEIGTKGLEWRTSLHDCVLVLDSSSFDGFIGSLLPDKKKELEFSFGTGFSSETGFFTTGDIPLLSGRGTSPAEAKPRVSARQRNLMRSQSETARQQSASAAPDSGSRTNLPDLPVLSTGAGADGMEIQIPIGKSLGPVRLHHALLTFAGAGSEDEAHAELRAAVSLSAKIGPVVARVDRIGLKFALEFPEDKRSANLHFANVALGFVPPTAIALTVDADAVKGGGFLFHDAAKHQYAGVMELSISGLVSVKAIGLIATRLPNGAKGYSLLILVTAEGFRPINLPMGFRLTGIGGLLAIHRTVNEDALREGLQNRSLESILFPKDPVRNATTILRVINTVFPARKGSHLFGLMLRVVWGVPTLITMDLALILELGSRKRFVVLGRISAILPRADHDLLRLNLEAIGIFDFDQGTVAIDAVLIDSRLLNRFPITGGGALRARWTSPRGFALAVGGMRHGFKPPANFPRLQRVSLSLTTGDNPRLTCDAYFAITSNTVQLGAHAHLYASAHGFSVQGDAGFDVLIQLNPFHFLAEIYAGMQLKRGSRNLFKVSVKGALEGPRPLTLRAKASFEIFWWDVSISVNCTLVEGQRPPPPPAVNALEQLRLALADPHSWHAELGRAHTRMINLREEAYDAQPGDSTIYVHPLSTLAVRQGVVPLNLSRDIDKFGDSPVVGARRFNLTGASIGGDLKALKEDFAQAQFFDMSDEEKLTSPSFQRMDAGARIESPGFKFRERMDSPLDYEVRVIDEKAAPPSESPVGSTKVLAPMTIESLHFHAQYGAAGRSALREDTPRSLPGVLPFAGLSPVKWSAVAEDHSKLALAPGTASAEGVTYTEAAAVARAGKRRRVVREFEVIR